MLAQGKMLPQTPHSALCHWQRKVRCLVADTDGVGPRAQGLCSGAYLASEQDIGLLNASSCDQLFGELGKGSCERDGRPRMSTFFAHVSSSWISSGLYSKYKRVTRNELSWVRLQLSVVSLLPGTPALQLPAVNQSVEVVPVHAVWASAGVAVTIASIEPTQSNFRSKGIFAA